MNNISFLDFNIIEVHPVHELFVWIQLFQHFMLFSTIMKLHFKLLDFFLFDEFSFVLEASQNDLVSTQVNNRIRENVENFSEYFLD
jgi:hypothetical protein